MNRNVESHFSELPSSELNRSIFDRSSTHKTSFNVGRLIPFYVDEVLPGDTFRVKTSKVIRLQTMLTPVMDNLYLDTYYFFVPQRLNWSHWQEFQGENNESAWIPETIYQVPSIYPPEGGFDVGTIADYMGLPVGVDWNGTDAHAPSALPFRAYARICDEWFKDENLESPLLIPYGDSNQEGSNGDDQINDICKGGQPFKVSKYHDYFTSCLPSPQKGPSVGVNLNGTVPVFAAQSVHPITGYNNPLMFSTPETLTQYHDYNLFGEVISANGHYIRSRLDSNDISGSVSESINAIPSNLIADLDLGLGSVNINELRLAFQLQKYYEKNARGGTRYIEILKSHFGVTSPDARLQRSEYLGGNRVPVNIHEVTNTAQSESDFLGDLGAMSVTSDIHDDFVHSFTEHGYVIGVCCLRYDHSYPQGLEKFWSRKTVTDFYLPVFANIGEQPVYKSEIYCDSSTINSYDVFGYQEAWADYRYKPDRVSGEMRPGVTNSLSSWHFADYYDEAPTLSASWIREDETNVDRTLAVTSTTANQCWADFYVQNICTRVMPMYSVPGLIDHH